MMPSATLRRRGCAGPQNPFPPFEASDVEQTIAARFESQVAKRPQALAVTDDAHRWSYEDLNGFANRIGVELLGFGEPNDAPIALLFEHGAPAIAAMLGVLKAGRCYVTLNVQQPAARLRRILEDCGAKIVVTNDRNATFANEISSRQEKTVSIDGFRGERRAGNLGVGNALADPATIIFTSGSTGLPKGVVHSQRNVLHNVMRLTNCIHLDASDRLDQLYSYDTGAAAPQTFGALLNGASLHLFDIRSRGFDDLAAWIAREKITIYHSVPHVFRGLVAALGADACFPELRLIRLDGEATSIADVELYRRRFARSAILLNVFGSTETGLISGFFVDADTRLDDRAVPAGYAMPDIDVLILDGEGREVAPGTPGRIAIRSDFLFCSYSHNPALTAAVITAGPDGKRTFHTADRGLILDDGCLVHLGRGESMVKIAGIAVEVAEVEAALLAGDDVSDVAVVGRPDRSGEMRLVAYVVTNAPPNVLRGRLARQLPSWMIPSAFVRMKSLPVNRKGKVDREALPDPAPAHYGADRPRDPLEVGLVAIWEELLEIEPIGIRDDFFEIGGDSLLALQLVARIEKLVRRHVPTSLLVEHPTVEQQARVLHDGGWSLHYPTVVPLQLGGALPPIFFVPGAGSDATSLIRIARTLGPEQPFYALQPSGQDGRQRPPRSVEELAARFVAEVRRTCPRGPYFLGGGSYGGLVAFEMAQRLTRAGQCVAFLGLLDTYAPRYPRMQARAPLRFQLFRRFGIELSQPPDRSAADMALHVVRIWCARIYVRLWQLSGRALTRRAGVFHFLDEALKAMRRYRSSSYPGKITLFRHEEQPSTALYDPDPLLGWGGVAQGGLDVVDVPGAHSKEGQDSLEMCHRVRERIRAAQAAIGLT